LYLARPKTVKSRPEQYHQGNTGMEIYTVERFQEEGYIKKPLLSEGRGVMVTEAKDAHFPFWEACIIKYNIKIHTYQLW